MREPFLPFEKTRCYRLNLASLQLEVWRSFTVPSKEGNRFLLSSWYITQTLFFCGGCSYTSLSLARLGVDSRGNVRRDQPRFADVLRVEPYEYARRKPMFFGMAESGTVLYKRRHMS